jgi:hypothetical protein
MTSNQNVSESTARMRAVRGDFRTARCYRQARPPGKAYSSTESAFISIE